MNNRIYAVNGKSPVHKCGQGIYSLRKQIGKKTSDNIESQKEYGEHNKQEYGYCGILARQNLIYPHASSVFLAFMTFDNGFFNDIFNKNITHIGKRLVAVKVRFTLHFDDAVFYHLALVFVKPEFVRQSRIALDELCCAEARRNSLCVRMVLYEVSHGVNAAVNRARTAKVRHGGANFVLCRFDHLINKFRNPFSFCGAYRNDRNTERGAHRHNVHRAAVCA